MSARTSPSGPRLVQSLDHVASPDVHVLQIGMGWFPEQAGGLNRVCYNLVNRLPAVGVRPHGWVAARATSMEGSPYVQAFAPPEATLSVRLWEARRVVEMLGEQRIDVVASHFALYTLPVLDRLAGIPLVVHFHGPWAAEGQVEGASALNHWVKGYVERRVYRRAQRFIVLSDAFRKVLVERYGVANQAVSVVPGGVDIARFDVESSRVEARAHLGWPLDRPTVLAVRRLAPRMGLHDLVAAVDATRRHVPEILVLVAGTGPLAAELQACVTASGLEHHVRLLGFVPDDDLPLIYRAADLSVVPTVALEGFGLIAAESLAAGTPVLVTPVGGLPEVVRDLSENLVLPATGARALAEGITAAITGTLPLPDSGACRRFASRYDWSEIVAQTADVYRSVLEG